MTENPTTVDLSIGASSVPHLINGSVLICIYFVHPYSTLLKYLCGVGHLISSPALYRNQLPAFLYVKLILLNMERAR